MERSHSTCRRRSATSSEISSLLAWVMAAGRWLYHGAPTRVRFAAETEDVVARARAKREAKHVDFIVANDVSRSDAGFDVDTNAVTIVGPDGPGDVVALPLQSKSRVAMAILDRVEKLVVPGPANAVAGPAKAGPYGDNT